MRLIKSRKLHQCKKCREDIWPGTLCYPLRRKQYFCFKCGYNRKPKKQTFIIKLLNWLGGHGEQKA